ncbi:carboxypeptidase-like regulatory domain-containing protein [Dactylosporangium sp. NPDC050688]|uniref:carboxypeptidase-like regulatory domain-containing protein n=1 Tax=Dactylosporangium sp. NPDC050688 TaxID=3157217 RepID=UPI0033DF72B2
MSTPGGCSNTSTGFECTIQAADLPADGSKSFTASFTPPGQSSIPAGQSRDVTGQLKINGGGGGSGSFKVTLKGPAQTAPATQTVQEVSGTVNDSTTGKVLKGASVNMEDGAGKSRSATTDDAGRFRFLGTETNPIAPGNISISVTMNGYDAASKDVTVQAGRSATGQRLALVPIGSTASPVVPSMEESTPAGDDTQSVAPGAANTANTSSDSGGGMSSYILIALGALLVIFGIVAIVLLLRRRGDDDDDEELDEEPAPRRGGGGQRPGYRQAQADPTMVGAMGGAPTMINRGTANDATAIVRPGRVNDYDVPPDPYGAPLPRAGSGYGAAGAGAGYGAANGGGYNDQAGFAQGAPSAGAGYGPSSRPAVDPYGPEYGAGGGGGYNDQPGYGGGDRGGAYADSTQRWEPAAGNGYAGGQSNGGGYGASGASGYGAEPGANGYGGGYNGNGANGYGPDQGANGYGPDQGGYGPAGGGAGGYGPSAGQDGYAPAGGGDGYPSAGGGYSPSAGNGYNGQSDYDGPYAGRGGYEQRGGYEPAAGYERDGYERVPEPPRAGNGYDGANGNYEQRGGYGEPQGSRGQAGGNRRSLDWLDD